MINLEIKSPIDGNIVFSDTINVNYKVTDTDGIFAKIIFNVYDKNSYDSNNKIKTVFTTEKEIRTEIFKITLPKAPGDYVLEAVIQNKFGKNIPSTEKRINFSINPITLELKNKLSSLVDSSIPNFLREDYAFFVDFVKYYYKWLESTKNINYIPHTLEQYLDVDNIPKELVQTFYKTYLNNFPTEFAKDKETNSSIDASKILKRIKDFYSKKGTEDSFRFLFRVMFDTEITFSYPREKILFVSDGKWKTPYIIKATNLTKEEIKNLIGSEIYVKDVSGNKTFSAIIEDTYSVLFNGKTYHTIFLNSVLGELNQSVVYYDKFVLGVFEEGNEITLTSMIVDNDWVNCPGIVTLPTAPTSPILTWSSKKFGFKVGERLKLKLLENDQTLVCVTEQDCENPPGDLNGDGFVTGADLGIVLGSFGPVPANHPADFNNDGKVSGADLGIFLGYYGVCAPCTPLIQIDQSVSPSLGFGFYAVVSEINETGQIIKINIIDPGINYTEDNIKYYSTKIYQNTESGVNEVNYDCRIRYKFGYLFKGKPYYQDNKSVLGNFCVLPDNFYYQQHSYEIGSNITSYRFDDILKTNAHPAGYKPFYRYDILDVIVEKPQTTLGYESAPEGGGEPPAFVQNQSSVSRISEKESDIIQTSLLYGSILRQFDDKFGINIDENYLIDVMLNYGNTDSGTDGNTDS